MVEVCIASYSSLEFLFLRILMRMMHHFGSRLVFLLTLCMGSLLQSGFNT